MSPAGSLTDQDIATRLEQRLGRVHARQRLGLERDHEAQIFGQGINFFHPENWSRQRTGLGAVVGLGAEEPWPMDDLWGSGLSD